MASERIKKLYEDKVKKYATIIGKFKHQGKSNEVIAKALGVSLNDFRVMKDEFEELKLAYEKAEDVVGLRAEMILYDRMENVDKTSKYVELGLKTFTDHFKDNKDEDNLPTKIEVHISNASMTYDTIEEKIEEE